MDQMERMEKFNAAIKRIAKTEDGILVFKMLEEIYVDSTALDSNGSEYTFYRLGQKEMIQSLIKDSKDD